MEPDAALVARLKRECSNDAGVALVDVRWWDRTQCLCIWGLDEERMVWTVRKTLKDPAGKPRQIHNGDLEDCKQALYEGRHREKDWYEREILDYNEKVDETTARDFKSECRDIIKEGEERARRGYCGHGTRGDVDCEDCERGKAFLKEAGVKVSDSRRRFFQ